MDFSMNLSFESIFTHEYVLALYGIVVYYSVLRELARRDFTKKHPKTKKFDGAAWRKENMDALFRLVTQYKKKTIV